MIAMIGTKKFAANRSGENGFEKMGKPHWRTPDAGPCEKPHQENVGEHSQGNREWHSVNFCIGQKTDSERGDGADVHVAHVTVKNSAGNERRENLRSDLSHSVPTQIPDLWSAGKRRLLSRVSTEG